MTILRYLSICLLLCFTASCSKTTVILMPDEHGSSGAVIVVTETESKTIDTPFHAATIRGATADAITVQPIDKEAVNRIYDASLTALPESSLSFTFYFVGGSTELTETSKKEVQNVVRQIKETEPPVILNIIGHTDSTGSKAINLRLSMERAQAVEAILRSSGAQIDIIRTQSFGENNPLVPTPDGVSEPKNRRVEVMVR